MPNTYTDTPIASHTLAADQPNMEANFLFLPATLGKDHQFVTGHTDATTFEGRHTQVSLNNRGSVIPIPGDGTSSVLFDNVGNLVWRNTAGVIGILGVNNTNYPKTIQNGTSWLPGTGSPFTGIGIQWGIKTIATKGTKTSVSFNTNFSATAYNVSLTPINNTGSASPSENMVYIDAGSVSNSGFTVTNSSSGSVTQIYWTAIGPV